MDLSPLDLPSLLAATLAVVLKREGDLVALIERVEASSLQGGRMNEHVLRAVFRRDKAKTLGSIEELNGSRDSHRERPFQNVR